MDPHTLFWDATLFPLSGRLLHGWPTYGQHLCSRLTRHAPPVHVPSRPSPGQTGGESSRPDHHRASPFLAYCWTQARARPVRLPEDKLTALKQELHEIHTLATTHKQCTKRQLLSLIGKLSGSRTKLSRQGESSSADSWTLPTQ